MAAVKAFVRLGGGSIIAALWTAINYLREGREGREEGREMFTRENERDKKRKREAMVGEKREVKTHHILSLINSCTKIHVRTLH